MAGAVYLEYDVSVGGRKGSFKARLGGASDPFAFGATTDLTVNINQGEIEAFRDAVWGANKIANIFVPRYRIVYESADVVNTVSNSMDASAYWKVAVAQTSGNFLIRIPGALNDPALLAQGSRTLADLNNAKMQAVIALAEAAPYSFVNPDKTIATYATPHWSAAQRIDASRRPPRENVSSSSD